MEPMSGAALADVMRQLRQATADMARTQDRMLSLTGEAWSDDRTVKVEVGPRGQLVDVHIDPAVFRRPDAEALREAILSASTAAVDDVMRQVQEIMAEKLPLDVTELRSQLPGAAESSDVVAQFLRSDAEIVTTRERPDER